MCPRCGSPECWGDCPPTWLERRKAAQEADEVRAMAEENDVPRLEPIDVWPVEFSAETRAELGLDEPGEAA
jgi:hypothetical protein